MPFASMRVWLSLERNQREELLFLLLLLCTNLSELTTALRGAPDLFSPTQVFSCVYFNCRLVSTWRPLP